MPPTIESGLKISVAAFCKAIASLSTSPAIQIYETQLNELSIQTQSLTADIGVKEAVLQEARDVINSKVHGEEIERDTEKHERSI